MQCYILKKGGERAAIPVERISAALEAGAVVVAPGAFRAFGYHRNVVEMVYKLAGMIAGPAKAQRLRALGVERLHEALSGPELHKLWQALRQTVLPNFSHVGRRVGREILRWPDPFYINQATVIRFLTPHRVLQENYAAFSKELGKLDLHGPHHDFWQNVAYNAINLWIALGRVTEENGMAIYADHWGRTLPRGDSHVRGDQQTGEPIRVACEAGDLVLFHAHHLHGSILNRSNETRLVITTRLTQAPPAYPDMTNPLTYYISDRMDGPDLAAAAYKPPLFAGAEAPETTSAPAPAGPADPRDLAEGQIMAIDKRTCVARVDGKLRAFGRRCPHQGADLACGHVADGQIRCPWHDYPFDPVTGRGANDALRPIRTYDLEEALARREAADRQPVDRQPVDRQPADRQPVDAD